MYIMLCGYPPFNGTNNEEIIQAIRLCNYSFLNDPWPSISDFAKNLIKKLLCAEEFRIYPKDALENE